MRVLEKQELSSCEGGYIPPTGGSITWRILEGFRYLKERFFGKKEEGGQFGGGGAGGSW